MRCKQSLWRPAVGAGLFIAAVPGCVSNPADQGLTDTHLPYAAYAFPKPQRAVSPPTPQRARKRAVAPAPHRREDAAGQAWMPSRGRISSRWTTIVIHHSATASGGAKPFDRYHRKKGWDGLGYHFVIGNGTSTPDGFVEVGARWHLQKHGAHCKTQGNYYNDHGIGICLVGDFTKTEPSPNQLASLTRLVQFLCDRCGIPPERVTTHRAVTGRTQCPGTNLHIGQLRRSLSTPRTITAMR